VRIPDIVELAATVEAIRPMVPSKDFATSRRISWEPFGDELRILLL
jgi:hypothetical protein